MKIIFLDVDGVINTIAADGICPAVMYRLKHILDTTGSHLVISSDWRKDRYQMLIDILGQYDILAPIGWTGVVKQNQVDWAAFPKNAMTRGAIRTTEITNWLNDNKNVTDFAVIDDHPMYFNNQFFKTNPYLGITDAMALTIIQHLGTRPLQNTDNTKD